MTCIERDISAEISELVKNTWIKGTNFDMVFYADDTIVVSRNLDAIEELLEGTTVGEYGLKLNIVKCVNLNMTTGERQNMGGGIQLENVEEATYLGNTMNKKALKSKCSGRGRETNTASKHHVVETASLLQNVGSQQKMADPDLRCRNQKQTAVWNGNRTAYRGNSE